jgi:plastocyanin
MIGGWVISTNSGLSHALSGNPNPSATIAGSNGGSSTPTSPTAVHIKETKAALGDVYFCDPASITINKGDTINFINDSDENQDFYMGDTQKAGVDFIIAVNGSKLVTFNISGTFTIVSGKQANITVTVN